MTCSRRKFVLGMGSVVFFSAPLFSTLAGTEKGKAVRYAMIHDETLCNGCNLCVTACRKVNDVPEGMARMSIAHIPLTPPDQGNQYHFFRYACQHCEEAPCITVCPTGASYRDQATGIVRVNRPTCIGCSYCISACPYQVRYLNPVTHVADKCDFCFESRLSKGFPPICVSACPQQALLFGREDSEPIQRWLKTHDYYRYQLPGAGEAHVYRRPGPHSAEEVKA
ncbi:4Fe-4S dicluster domain-containing protein [Musicola paradisiaca]|uniref:4Fe-4S ferredoxin iron-sulfur binding domain protein n=1 Tax=Musicola paradisiaca (strain Ech703) TaxID=579405 RepID=C6C7I3_MUSP7|nr:4Fe-4S dicluster domain-containing protein [Musicola paradisiaca]ACS84101.1 4Fe-4S ferredoxin iron-sulfur binding domain protein [Musicola paradisiaca Ech703]